jgi:hypothetical protein
MLLAAAAERLHVRLSPSHLDLAPGTRISLDGFAAGPPALAVKVFSHIGPLKTGQRHRVLASALKLAAVRKVVPGARLLIVLGDDDAARGVRGGWRRIGLEALGVEVLVLPLPLEIAARLRSTQLKRAESPSSPSAKTDDTGKR